MNKILPLIIASFALTACDSASKEAIGEKDISELPDKDQRIYVYCRSGNRSKQAAEKLVKLGYKNIVEIGGINDYHGEVETN